jgi:hypothetical protein
MKPWFAVGVFHLPPGHGHWDGLVLEEPYGNWVKLKARHWVKGSWCDPVWINLDLPHSIVPIDSP